MVSKTTNSLAAKAVKLLEHVGINILLNYLLKSFLNCILKCHYATFIPNSRYQHKTIPRIHSLYFAIIICIKTSPISGFQMSLCLVKSLLMPTCSPNSLTALAANELVVLETISRCLAVLTVTHTNSVFVQPN